jgi:hypothetical protein
MQNLLAKVCTHNPSGLVSKIRELGILWIGLTSIAESGDMSAKGLEGSKRAPNGCS